MCYLNIHCVVQWVTFIIITLPQANAAVCGRSIIVSHCV